MSIVCPKCATVNPADANFCFNCGIALGQGRCGHCGAGLPAEARFCANCGRPVDSSSLRDREPAPAPISNSGGERKVVTSLFVDVVDSTALAEQFDPEEWTGIMNQTFRRLSPPILDYDGTIARLMGDALLAFFGAPRAHEDDPVRAVRAALDLLDRARGLADEMRAQYGIQFAIRAGLSTGLVVVGQIGSEWKSEYTAMGDAVNLAARLQAAARPMTALISEHTYRFVAPFFECLDLGDLELRGKSAPVRVYEVVRARAVPGRRRGLAGVESPLVGRDAELAGLMAAGAAVQAGHGRIVVVVGEAGLGKSRLVAEWKATTGAGLRWAEAGAPSHARVPYHLVLGLLRSILGVPWAASEPETRAALMGLCNELFGHQAVEVYSYLGHLLSLELDPSSHQRVSALDPQELPERYLEALRRLLLALAARGPLALLLDDIHWSDVSSGDLLAHLLPLTARAPLLFCLLTRPDRGVPGWKLVLAAREQGRLTELTLEPLPESASRRLVANLLPGGLVQERLRELVLHRAEGNPFFAEELARTLLEHPASLPSTSGAPADAPVAPLDIPQTLQGLLLARIDRLPQEARRTLRVAAVIGRQFSVGVLEQVAGPLNGQLILLESAGLIRPVDDQPEPEYLFPHTLLHEAAYASLLHQERRQLHLAVGKALEEAYPARMDELAATLAAHFEQGEAWAKAVRYFGRAGTAALDRYALPEAIESLSHAIQIATVSGLSPVQWYRPRGKAYEMVGEFDRARADYESALEMGRKAGDLRAEWQALVDLGMLWQARDYGRTGLYLQEALSLAREVGDSALLGHSLNWVGNWYVNRDYPEEAERHHREALAIFRRLDDRAGIAGTLDLLGLATLSTGDPASGAAYLREAIELFRALGDRQRVASALSILAVTSPNLESSGLQPAITLDEGIEYTMESLNIAREIGWRAGEAYALAMLSANLGAQGEYGRAFEAASESLAVSEAISHGEWMAAGHFGCGLLYLDILSPGLAVQHLEQSLELARSIRSLNWERIIVPALARAHALAGDLDHAARLLADTGALDPSHMYGSWLLGFSHIGHVALMQGNPAQALEIAERASRRVTATGARGEEVNPRMALLAGAALTALGHYDEAETRLRAAMEVAARQGARPLLWRIGASLAALYTRTERDEEARRERESAHEIVAALATTIADEGIRSSFLKAAEERIRSGMVG